MSDHLLPSIDFSPYQRWLNRAAGGDTAFLVFDRKGEVLWGGEHALGEALGTSIATAAKGGRGVQRHDMNGAGSALYLALGASADGPLGWSAILLDPVSGDDAPRAADQLADMLEDVAAGISSEYTHEADLLTLTEELGARYEELHLVYAIDHHVQAHTGTSDRVFQSLLDSAAEHLAVDVAAFVCPSRQTCLYATALSKEIHNLDLVLVEMRGDLYRFVQAAGETVVLNAESDPRRAYIFTDMPYKVLGCPVRSQGRIDAMIILLNHADKPDFSNSDRKLAEVLANQISSLSSTYTLLDGMKEFNQQLAMALIEAVEAKDPYTRGHSERVHFLSMEIGKAYGLTDKELDDLHWGSLLHDVGKIGIPDAVLCKPSRLDKDEYTFIMVHPERSYEILHHIRHLDKAVLGARHHHEMFDGNGYPNGLKGENIPLHARIIAVADTYDSITSSRAYRPGRSHELAMRELERVSGSQLDPAIIDIFRQIVATEPEWLGRFKIRREKA